MGHRAGFQRPGPGAGGVRCGVRAYQQQQPNLCRSRMMPCSVGLFLASWPWTLCKKQGVPSRHITAICWGRCHTIQIQHVSQQMHASAQGVKGSPSTAVLLCRMPPPHWSRGPASLQKFCETHFPFINAFFYLSTWSGVWYFTKNSDGYQKGCVCRICASQG